MSDSHGEIHPHTEQTHPGEELNHREALHRAGHRKQGLVSLLGPVPDAGVGLALALELFDIFRWIFGIGHDGEQNRHDENDAAKKELNVHRRSICGKSGIPGYPVDRSNRIAEEPSQADHHRLQGIPRPDLA